MSDQRRYESAPLQDEIMSTSIAAGEAFSLLNAATKEEFRGWGDTKTAARDRAARKAGVTSAQAERLWKNWQTMKTVNGDVYRSLLLSYSHLCEWVETSADRLERDAAEIEEKHATSKSGSQAGAGVAGQAKKEQAR
jgi:phage major head subunit gpT-like protein